jgi:hypothetical protein
MGNHAAKTRSGPLERGPDLHFHGADDEIRTRDPHLGKKIERSRSRDQRLRANVQVKLSFLSRPVPSRARLCCALVARMWHEIPVDTSPRIGPMTLAGIAALVEHHLEQVMLHEVADRERSAWSHESRRPLRCARVSTKLEQ